MKRQLEKTCLHCGKPFIGYCRGYCSKECKRLAYLQRLKERAWNNKKPKKCVVCGKDFIFYGVHGAKAVCCSDECKKIRTKELQKKRYAKMTTEQKAYRKEYCTAWKEKNRDKLNQYGRDRNLHKRQQKAVDLQKTLISSEPTKKPWLLKNTYQKTLHLERLSRTRCKCLDCGMEFELSVSNPSNASSHLDNMAKNGVTICPSCGTHPEGVAQRPKAEGMLQMEYPNLTIKNYRPDWMEGMEIDLYDPVARVGIEYHGIYGHSTKCMQDSVASRKHKHKADLCEKNGVHLVQLYETEWEQKREIVKDKLDAIFHKDMKRLFARKLKVMILGDRDSRTSAMKFLDKNHIQGRTACQWAVGLLDGMELVAVCTFKYGTAYAIGGQTGGTGKYWELNRYATKLGYSIVGGLSRCIKAFAKTHPEVRKIVSFADRRWTSRLRSAYSSSGFVEVAECEPNYQYTDLDSRHELKNKQYMRKSQIAERASREGSPESAVYSPDKTESQMSKELGYYRVYDAGKIRYEMTL